MGGTGHDAVTRGQPASVGRARPGGFAGWAVRRDRSGHQFYVGTAIAALITVGLGFGPALVNPASRRASPTPLVIAHGLVTLVWLILYLTQTILIARGYTRLHRQLGTASIPLAVVVIVVGYEATIAMVRRGFDLSGDLLGHAAVPLPRLLGSAVFPLAGLVQFGALAGAALLYRRRSDVHKRLMVLATANLMVEPLAHLFGHWRIPFRFFGPTFSLLPFSSAIHDRLSLGRMHRVSLWGAVGLSALNLLFATVVRSSTTWQQFVAWLAG
jgi:hypothetical protein